jgi:NADPH:quinone reductase-like Zn-dependent oxidoreductase
LHDKWANQKMICAVLHVFFSSMYIYAHYYITYQAYTVDKRDLMIRPGVRCTDESLPQGVTTIGMDCIGRVVQLTNHARAIYGISIDDRIAAIYPFDYNTDDIRRNSKHSYALVDAGFVVAVPKHVDAAEAACMIRLYLPAFQSILLGIGFHRDRYGNENLAGQSILIENGHTDYGRVLIELAALLGATKIFATGPIEYHPLLDELGAIPLGAETFSWELFLETKIGLVLIQEMPTEGMCLAMLSRD